ncbi:MAG: hypothetical protein LBS25_08915 [Candidatus Symbiothrix sp.]|jgi:hypothetical protein|nr:hypothetical protein [Candidatus Symbiothrix sp.]
MQIQKTFLFIIGVIALLAVICAFFPEDGITIGDNSLYFPSIEEIMNDSDGHSTAATERIKRMEESLRIQQYQDSVYADSMAIFQHFFETHPSRIRLPENNWRYFHDLFESFDSCRVRKKVIHILHYGDSQIEGDRITGFIRQELQEKFGGNGPGLLPAVQVIPSAAVGQTASENIARYIIAGSHKNQAPHRRYGALGQVGMFSGHASIGVNARNNKNTYENVKSFRKIRLFVGKSNPKFKATLSIGNKQPKAAVFGSTVKTFTWNLGAPIKQFKLQLTGSGEIYGLSVDGESGVAVDNIPFRGSSGTFFSTMDSEVLQSMYKTLNVGLILLEFGGNVMPSIKNEKQILSYKETISKQIAYLKRIHPQAKIILIGPADMSKKVAGKLQTYPHLEEVVCALEEAALQSGAGYWNMYDVMGGQNSMIDWVKSSPKLAAPDYIHFTNRGAERIAHLFYESLMRHYDYYRFDLSHSK